MSIEITAGLFLNAQGSFTVHAVYFSLELCPIMDTSHSWKTSAAPRRCLPKVEMKLIRLLLTSFWLCTPSRCLTLMSCSLWMHSLGSCSVEETTLTNILWVHVHIFHVHLCVLCISMWIPMCTHCIGVNIRYTGLLAHILQCVWAVCCCCCAAIIWGERPTEKESKTEEGEAAVRWGKKTTQSDRVRGRKGVRGGERCGDITADQWGNVCDTEVEQIEQTVSFQVDWSCRYCSS